jgi:ketosteroid isomerase-like protein
MMDHAVAIRRARAASNAAIAARDAEQVVMHMLPDVVVSVARGPVLRGREASRAAFAEQFADRAFLGYVREADDVEVHEPPLRATERGRWTGRWRRGLGEHVMRGTYRAEWQYTAMGWLIGSEVFVPSAEE